MHYLLQESHSCSLPRPSTKVRFNVALIRFNDGRCLLKLARICRTHERIPYVFCVFICMFVSCTGYTMLKLGSAQGQLSSRPTILVVLARYVHVQLTGYRAGWELIMVQFFLFFSLLILDYSPSEPSLWCDVLVMWCPCDVMENAVSL